MIYVYYNLNNYTCQVFRKMFFKNVTCKSKFPHDMEFTFTKYTLFVYGIY